MATTGKHDDVDDAGADADLMLMLMLMTTTTTSITKRRRKRRRRLEQTLTRTSYLRRGEEEDGKAGRWVSVIVAMRHQNGGDDERF